jgi:hypothetical protein
MKMYVVSLINYPEPNDVGGIYSTKELARQATNEFCLNKNFRDAYPDEQFDRYKALIVRQNSKYFTSYEDDIRNTKLSDEYKDSEELQKFWISVFNYRECKRTQFQPSFEILEIDVDKEVTITYDNRI